MCESFDTQISSPEQSFENIPLHFLYRKVDSDDVKRGNVAKMVASLKTLGGSLKYQRQLEFLRNNMEINFLLVELSPYLSELMCSKHGNYFVQKLIRKTNFNQRLYILELIQENFIQICKDDSGTHAIQALLESIKTKKEQLILERLFKPHLLELFCNVNSHHIIQKIIIDFPEEEREYLNEFIIENIDEISLNEYGFHCMLKFIIMTNRQSIKERLAKEMSSIAIFTKLVSSRYGAGIMIHSVISFGIKYFEQLFMKLRDFGNLIFYVKLNQYSAGFIGKFFEYISKLDHSYYVNFFYTLIQPKVGFVDAILENFYGEKLLFFLLNLSDINVVRFFIKCYNKSNSSTKEKSICQHLNLSLQLKKFPC